MSETRINLPLGADTTPVQTGFSMVLGVLALISLGSIIALYGTLRYSIKKLFKRKKVNKDTHHKFDLALEVARGAPEYILKEKGK